jgi:small subunit ribosomal protein S6
LRGQERAPRGYELMTVLHPEVPEESLSGELERISGFIGTAGGEIIETLQDSPWGRRRLAYPIRSGGRDVRDGYYTVWHVNLAPHRITDLERELKLDTQLIRYMIVNWEPKKLTAKEIEAAEFAAEDAAAAAYEAAQVAAAAAAEADEDAAAAAYEADSDEAAATTDEAAGYEAEAASAEALTAQAEALTAQAEALEATGAELAIEPAEPAAIEPVAAVEEREELAAEAAAALAQAEAAATAATAAEDDVPAGAVRGDGTADCPEEYPIKGNAGSMLFHSPGSPSYTRTVPEFCFASTEAAEAAGFGPTKYEAAHEEAEAE